MIYEKIRSAVKQSFKHINPYSPYPLFYPFEMTHPERHLFDRTIRRARWYLEFGLGGSTIRALQKSDTKVYTVETSREWIENMRTYWIIRKNEGRRLLICEANIGPVGKWGYPEQDVNVQSFDAYFSSISQSLDLADLDVALIDGRFRVASVSRLILTCHSQPSLKIMIHDFWKRPDYHILLEYLDLQERADSLGLFKIKKNVKLQNVEKTLQEYKCVTR